MFRAKWWMAAGLAVAFSGCAYDEIGNVSYRSDGTFQHTPWGQTQPAPASASSMQVTPQDPSARASYQEQATKKDCDPSCLNRTYYRRPSHQEVAQRTAMLMKMNAQMKARAPAPKPSGSRSRTGNAASVSHGSTREVALVPLPGSTGTRAGLIDQREDQNTEQRTAIPSGQYKVTLDFDKSIPVAALKTLLGVEKGAFSSRIVESGDRRIFLGAFEAEDQAKAMRSRVEADTGLTPQIRDNRS